MRARLVVGLVVVLLAPLARAAEPRWFVEAAAIGAIPQAPETFVDGWASGLGVGGGLLVRIAPRLHVGVHCRFVQFGFDGLAGFGSLGGERRLLHAAVPLQVVAHERRSPGAERWSIETSLGWAHQNVIGTFGSLDSEEFSFEQRDAGVAVTAGVGFSRILYRRTRWLLQLCYGRVDLDVETPEFLSLAIGAQMPLAGSRPR